MLDILFNIFFAFFMGQWEEYHTGLMNTNNGASDLCRRACVRRRPVSRPPCDAMHTHARAGYVGITEGQVVQIGILLVTATLGAEAWDWTLFSLPVRGNE